MGAIRCLNSKETKESIDFWYNQCRSLLRAVPSYQHYVDKTWTALALHATRGFVDKTEGGVVQLTAQTQNTQVEGLIDLVCSYCPELDVHHIREEATSLQFIYLFCREHYGFKRTGRQMMQKISDVVSYIL